MSLNIRLLLSFMFMPGACNVLMADTIDASGQAPYEQCGYCHEYDGNSKMSSFPRLAGQTSAYLAKQLRDFRSAKRTGTMQATAELLTNDEIKIVSDYFSQQSLENSSSKTLSDRQKAIATKLFLTGDSARGLQSCGSCHGMSGEGVSAVPRLAGQHATYLFEQLVTFKSGARTNDQSGQMQAVSKRLSDAEMKALAQLFEQL